MNVFRTALKKRQEEGFSLVEMAIVLVIIGLIVSAIAVGKTTMRKAEANKCMQTFLKPWIEAGINAYNADQAATSITNPNNLPTSYTIGGATFSSATIDSTTTVGKVILTFALDAAMDTETWTELERAVDSGIGPIADTLVKTNGTAGIVATISVASKGN